MSNNIAVSITADVADLQVKRAIMSAELRVATKDLNDFAKEAASTGSTDALRTGMLAAGDAVAKFKAQISSVDSELKGHSNNLNHGAASAGQMRFAMQNLSYQISDVGTSLAGGINPMVVFAQQGNQIVGALSLMKTEATGLVGFLAGPWGAALMAAGALIGVLISKHEEAAAKAALHAHKAMDLKSAIDQLNQATGAANRTVEQQAKDALAAAEALYKQELQARRTTAAMLDMAIQRYATAESPTQNLGWTSSEIAATAGAAGDDVRKLTAKLAGVNAQLAEAQKGFRGATGFFLKQGVDDQFDAAAAATHRFERSVASLDERMRAGKVTAAQYAAEYRSLKQVLETQEGAAKSHGGAARGTSAKKQATSESSLPQRLDDELTAKKLSWALENDAHGTAIAFSLQLESDYWKQILDRTDLSAKDRGAIEAKYLAAHSQLVRERISVVIDGYRQEFAEAGRNAEARLEIANRELAYIGKTFGVESKEYAQAQAEIVRIKREAAEQIRQIDQIHAQSVDKINLDAIAVEESAAKHRVAMGVETNAQLLAQEQAFENRRHAIEAAAAARSRALVNPKDDPVRAAQLDLQLEQLERQHQQRLTQIDQQAALQRTAIQRNAITSVSSSWAQSIGKMVTLQAGFGATVKSMWQGLQQAIGNALASILEQWLAKHIATLLLGRAASSAAGAAQVASAAGIAGANGVASWALAPWPIDAGAPGFGASMAAAAAAFAPAASAAGGWWDVPSDQTARIHAREMVLPAWAAQPLRTMLMGGGAANNNAPGAANDSAGSGDVHLHFNGPTNKREIERWIADHSAGVVNGVRKAFRNGSPLPK